MNFVAIVTALRSFADGSEKTADPARYYEIPNNSSGNLLHIVFRNANVFEKETGIATTADLGLVFDRRREQFISPMTIRRMGALTTAVGLTEYDASGFNVIGRMLPVKQGNPGELLFFKKDRKIDWTSPELEKQTPDAVFSFGKWLKGEGAVPLKK